MRSHTIQMKARIFSSLGKGSTILEELSRDARYDPSRVKLIHLWI